MRLEEHPTGGDGLLVAAVVRPGVVEARLDGVACGGADAERRVRGEGMDVPEGGLVRDLVRRVPASVLDVTQNQNK